MDNYLDPHLHKLIYSSVVSAVSIYGQFTTVLMTTNRPAAESKVQWNIEETNTFLDYLLENSSEAGNGYNFKLSTFSTAVSVLAKAQLLLAGPLKTEKRYRTKWTTVCDL